MSQPLVILAEPPDIVAASPRKSYAWLFSAPVDIAVFLGSAIISLLALVVGGWLGILHGGTPDWAWVPAILLIDVAHVWATGFRVYFDPEELRRRPLLYAAVPIAGFLIGVALYSEGQIVFWRTLAYLAVFHFVRQQYGWVALYRARAREPNGIDKWIDVSAIYLATLYPLLYWHCHLPRRYWWFLKGDFQALPTILEQVVAPLYCLALALYAVRAASLWLKGQANPGKDIVVATTALCWHVGIITFNSDYAFTVTNVVIHGVPYLALVYWYRYVRGENTESRMQNPGCRSRWRRHLPTVLMFLGVLWMLAYAEEMIWDRAIWHDHDWLFGAWEIDAVKTLLVPLLALPQLTHYILDGFIWKRRSNPDFSLVS